MQNEEFVEAVKKNETHRIVQLLETDPMLANARDESAVSAIFLALYRGNEQAAKEIASRKVELDVFEAAALGDMDLLKILIGHNQSLVRSYSADGFTALALAAYLGQKESAEYLIDKGADPNAVAHNETGFSALTGAVSQNHNEVARLLIKRGASVNYTYEGGFTPLMHASYAGNLELVSFLLENGADPNAKNGEGKTPLVFAREKGHNAVVEQLMKHGAA